MEARAATAEPEARLPFEAELQVVRALVRRALNEIIRVPGAAIPGVLAPSIFMLGLSAVFGKLSDLPGFPVDSYISFLIPVSMMQGAAFAGAATGVNLARDIEQGWFDRLLLAPNSRISLLAGIVLSASIRCLLPATLLLIVGFAFGVTWPGVDGLLVALPVIMGMGAVAASWGTVLALRFKSQSAAPLMQSAMFVAVLFTTSYAPQELLTGWLSTVAQINPVTHALEAVRQGFIGDVSWSETWPGLVTVAGLTAGLALLALRGLTRITR
ncbi:MAG: ABC transporter permease [Solirubrobacterales bacterium]